MAQQGQSSTSKGNPAHHRMTNAQLKARRAFSWSKHKKDVIARNAAQEKAKQRNLHLQIDELTPWETAKAARAARRAADPEVQRRAMQYR